MLDTGAYWETRRTSKPALAEPVPGVSCVGQHFRFCPRTEGEHRSGSYARYSSSAAARGRTSRAIALAGSSSPTLSVRVPTAAFGSSGRCELVTNRLDTGSTHLTPPRSANGHAHEHVRGHPQQRAPRAARRDRRDADEGLLDGGRDRNELHGQLGQPRRRPRPGDRPVAAAGRPRGAAFGHRHAVHIGSRVQPWYLEAPPVRTSLKRAGRAGRAGSVRRCP